MLYLRIFWVLQWSLYWQSFLKITQLWIKIINHFCDFSRTELFLGLRLRHLLSLWFFRILQVYCCLLLRARVLISHHISSLGFSKRYETFSANGFLQFFCRRSLICRTLHHCDNGLQFSYLWSLICQDSLNNDAIFEFGPFGGKLISCLHLRIFNNFILRISQTLLSNFDLLHIFIIGLQFWLSV